MHGARCTEAARSIPQRTEQRFERSMHITEHRARSTELRVESTRDQLEIRARDQSSRSAARDQLEIRARDQQLESSITRSELEMRSEPEIRAPDEQLEISSRSGLEISSSRS